MDEQSSPIQLDEKIKKSIEEALDKWDPATQHRVDEESLMTHPAESNFFAGVINDDTMEYGKMRFRDTYELIKQILGHYMVMPDKYLTIASVWAMGTYFHDSFQTYPYLFVNAMRGSGKSRLLKLLSHLTKHGCLTNNLTESVLFRSAQAKTCIILDEFENVGTKEKSTLRELLNSAYKKGASVKRMRKKQTKEGEEQVMETFNLYTPVAIANIWGMEEVLADRCITLILEKTFDPNKTKLIEDFDDNLLFKEIKRTLERSSVVLCSVVTPKNSIRGWNNYIKTAYKQKSIYTTTYTKYNTYNYRRLHKEDEEELLLSATEIETFKKIDDTEIDGRNLELFLPLFFIAKTIGADVFDELIGIAKDSVREKRTDEFMESADVSFIDFISKKHISLEYRRVIDLTREFREFVQDDQEEVRWLNSRWVGRALKRLKLCLDKRRVSQGMEVILDVPKAKERIKMFKTAEEIEGK